MSVTIVERVVNDLMERFVKQTADKAKEKPKVKWEVTKEEDHAGNWEYKVITTGWKMSLKERRQRKILARVCCYAKILTKVYSKETRRKEGTTTWRWMPEIEEAIRKLANLREFAENTQRAITTAQKPTCQPKRTAEELRRNLYGLWMEFTNTERIKDGKYTELSKLGEGKCRCRKGKISYPHWPPTSVEETTKQFELCRDDNNTHRRDLTIRWWSHFNELANMTEWKASEKQQRYRDAEALIRENSEMVQRELNRSTTIRKRPKGWKCHEYCEPVLKEKRCSCLCHCEEHRDLCPTHS